MTHPRYPLRQAGMFAHIEHAAVESTLSIFDLDLYRFGHVGASRSALSNSAKPSRCGSPARWKEDRTGFCYLHIQTSKKVPFDAESTCSIICYASLSRFPRISSPLPLEMFGTAHSPLSRTSRGQRACGPNPRSLTPLIPSLAKTP